MYLVCEKNDSECPVLLHGPDVFTRAHALASPRIHVLMSGGRDYDLVYVKNSECRPDFIRNRWRDEGCYPDYDVYSSDEKDGLYLDFFRIFRRVYIRSANEYSVALAKVILQYTDLEIFSSDERMKWFTGDRVPIIGEDEMRRGKDALVIGTLKDDEVFDLSFHSVGPVCAFHNVFFLQGQGAFSPEKYRYAELAMDDGAGIGSVLNNLFRFRKALAGIGLVPVVRGDKVGHFNVSFLEEYFNLKLSDPAANNENTLFFPEMSALSSTMFLDWVKPEPGLWMLRESFINDMREYADAIIGGKRILGVLIRGTDYLIVHKDGPRKMAGVDDIIPLIHAWLNEFSYEGIFLATEDRDVLSRMQDEFGSSVRVIAQERHSVSELSGCTLLSELEKKNASDYDGSVAESTVNYFYALYMLSRCSAFICSGPCNGYDLAVGFNGGRFERTHLFKAD